MIFGFYPGVRNTMAVRGVLVWLIVCLSTVMMAPDLQAWKAKSKAKGPAFEDYGEFPADKALVYVYRGGEEYGYDRKFGLRLGEDKVTLLRSGGYFPMVVDPGEVVLSASKKWGLPHDRSRLTLDLKPGVVYYIRFVQEHKGAYFKVRLEVMFPGTGAEEIKSCKKLKPHDSRK